MFSQTSNYGNKHTFARVSWRDPLQHSALHRSPAKSQNFASRSAFIYLCDSHNKQRLSYYPLGTMHPIYRTGVPLLHRVHILYI